MPFEYRDDYGDAYGTCDACGDEGYLAADTGDGDSETYCPDCAVDRAPISENETPAFQTDYETRDSPMRLPILEERGARLISFEQEVGKGGRYLASQLYAAGYANSDSIRGYHSGETTGGFVYVEQDASVDAEVIYSRMRLDSLDGAARFESALNVVRQAIKDGESKLDMRCGGHVHVSIGGSELSSAQRYGMHDVESLYHLWNHVEDVMYRLGSANWRTHREIIAGHGYAEPTQKGMTERGRGRFGRHMETSRSSLNFSNYLAARGSCRCGAFAFEDWSSCECELPKATVEFRVFNATANLRKIHAYTALCLALVEYAKHNRCTEQTHPRGDWTRAEHVGNAGMAREALRFILWDLPLTHEERQDIRYCAENSSLRDVLAELPRQRRPRRSREVATTLFAG
jgi:hypothetical protein